MKTVTNIAILSFLLVMTIAGSGAVSFFGGCGLFFFLLGVAMDFYAVEQEEKKNEPMPSGASKNQSGPAQPPAGTNPATVSNGSATEGITNGKGYSRNDEQAQAGNYTDPDAPADTVQIANVAAPAKPIPSFELEIK